MTINLRAAVAATRPAVIQARVDPNVAPFPPHITLKQAHSFGMSLLKADSEEGGIIKQPVRQLFASVGEKA